MEYSTTYPVEFERQLTDQRERAEVKRKAMPLSEMRLPNVTQRQIEKNIAALILKALTKETA
jgi:hypothetical protein